jgi:chaperonin GroES
VRLGYRLGRASSILNLGFEIKNSRFLFDSDLGMTIIHKNNNRSLSKNGVTDEGHNRISQVFMEAITMQVRPLHDRVLVKRTNEEEKSKGGIIIPDTAKEKPAQGEIIAVGQGRVGEDGKVRPLDVKKGDKVLFGKYAGTEIKIDGDEFLMMREEDILGVIAH